MFLLGRDHLKAVATAAGISQVTFKPQAAGGSRRCDIFTLPNRGRLAQPLIQPRNLIKRWRDWNDLDSKSQPKIKEREVKAEQRITFRVVLTHTTADKVNTDFKNYIRNLDKYIYDGETADYINGLGQNKSDTKGNVIEIVLGSYDFNDNRFYGDITSRVLIDVEFVGNIYASTDVVAATRDVPAGWVVPSIDNVTNQ